MFLKHHANGTTAEIGYDDFKDRIRKGEIFPQDQVQDRILTNDEWRTVDNLRIFHRLAPLHYAKGRHLQAREMAEDEKQRLQESLEIQRSAQEALARKFFQTGETGNDFILSCLYEFLIACGEEPLMGEELAVRFTYLPSFHESLFVRVSRRGAEWELHYKSGKGPRKTRALRASDEVPRILELVEAVDLAELLENDRVWGLDGSFWAVEVTRQDKYVFRSRWSPTHKTTERRLTTFVELGKYLAGLSDLLSPPEEMY